MRDAPSRELIELLAKLRLATPERVRAMRSRVRRLAGSLPHFDSVWIDALAQARVLTPYQAQEINAGRGELLLMGSYVACAKAAGWGYAQTYLGCSIGDVRRRAARRRPRSLLISASVPEERSSELSEQLAGLIARSREIESPHFQLVREFELTGGRLWMAADASAGTDAGEWMVENGRMPPLVVLNIARQMIVGLCELERLQLTHGDLRAARLKLLPDGMVVMPLPGLREILRPTEWNPVEELPPECYDAIAPERIAEGSPVTVSTDLFSCGCVWWQLLTGRSAIAGADSASKRRFAAGGTIPDVRQLAPDAPPVLAEVIAMCTARRPADRPRSFAEVASILGPPSELGTRMIVCNLRDPQRWILPRAKAHRRSRWRQHVVEVASVAACIFVMLGAWKLFARGPSTVVAGAVPVAAAPRLPVAVPPKPVPSDEVTAAAYVEPEQTPVTRPRDVRKPVPLELPSNRLVRLQSIEPTAGQRIQGAANARARVMVPPGGLVIETPDVVFANIDFVAAESVPSDPIVVLRTPTAHFEDCTFLGGGEEISGPAVDWQELPESADEWTTFDDELRFTNCVFHRVGAAIERNRTESAKVTCINTLHVASGPFVRLRTGHGSEQALTLELQRCTLRESASVLDLMEIGLSGDRPSRFAVVARNCVLAPRASGALVQVSASRRDKALDDLRWNGRESLVDARAALVHERSDDDRAEAVDDLLLDATGLVRSRLSFSGEDLSVPEDSRLLRWLAPRQSQETPGIDPARLPTRGLDLTKPVHDLGLH